MINLLCQGEVLMNNDINLAGIALNSGVKTQISESVDVIREILGKDLLGMYLYGSAITGGLEKYSDIDLFVVSNRATTDEEKNKLMADLLKISGIYMKSDKLPIEITIVEKSEVNPWKYPPKFDFQYGEWLREQFEQGNIESCKAKEMPDLAILITQTLLASQTLVGASPDQLLCAVPYKDFMTAMADGLPGLMSELTDDTRNVLLTLARVWSTVETDEIRSKPAAADWSIKRLPEKHCPIMRRAKAICTGKEEEHWDDIQELIKPCADFMLIQARNQIAKIMSSDDSDRSISIA